MKMIKFLFMVFVCCFVISSGVFASGNKQIDYNKAYNNYRKLWVGMDDDMKEAAIEGYLENKDDDDCTICSTAIYIFSDSQKKKELENRLGKDDVVVTAAKDVLRHIKNK